MATFVDYVGDRRRLCGRPPSIMWATFVAVARDGWKTGINQLPF